MIVDLNDAEVKACVVVLACIDELGDSARTLFDIHPDHWDAFKLALDKIERAWL